MLTHLIVTKRKGLVDRDEDCSDTLIALQHPPAYTLGTDSSEDYLRFNVQDPPSEIHRIDRGGEVTYHGPGQLVMYTILNLRYHKMDLHWYLRSLEEVIICALKSSFSIKASRVDGLTGVWVGDRKVASIGIHVSWWIAYHGLALNVTADLTPFEMIVPCGIKDRGVMMLLQWCYSVSSFFTFFINIYRITTYWLGSVISVLPNAFMWSIAIGVRNKVWILLLLLLSRKQSC